MHRILFQRSFGVHSVCSYIEEASESELLYSLQRALDESRARAELAVLEQDISTARVQLAEITKSSRGKRKNPSATDPDTLKLQRKEDALQGLNVLLAEEKNGVAALSFMRSVKSSEYVR